MKHYSRLIRGSHASNLFDLLRGIAALWVVLFHLRPVIYLGYDKLSHPNIVIKGLYFLTSIGPQWVMVFFILSGYLISSSVLNYFKNNQWSWKNYLFNRLVRLWTVLLPALLLTVFWSKIQMVYSGYGIDDISFFTFIGNFFFLQGVFSPNFGENVALWSLSFEFWYYILFPCVILIFYSKKIIKKIFYLFILLILSWILGKEIMLYFIIWLMGASLCFIKTINLSFEKLKPFLLILSSGLLFLALCSQVVFSEIFNIKSQNLIFSFPFNFSVGVCTTILLYLILSFYNKNADAIYRFNYAVIISSFSYTLYLTHYPVLSFIRVLIGDGKWGTWYPNINYLLYGIGIFVMIILYAYGVALFSELQTSKIKKFIKSKVSIVIGNNNPILLSKKDNGL